MIYIKSAYLLCTVFGRNDLDISNIDDKDIIYVFIEEFPRIHRHIWTEERLIILQVGDTNCIDNYMPTKTYDNNLGMIQVTNISDVNVNIEHYLASLICNDFGVPFDKSWCPKYHILNPHKIIKSMSLLCFI